MRVGHHFSRWVEARRQASAARIAPTQPAALEATLQRVAAGAATIREEGRRRALKTRCPLCGQHRGLCPCGEVVCQEFDCAAALRHRCEEE